MYQHIESARERVARDKQYAEAVAKPLTDWDRIEMDSHIRALRLTGSERVLELGAGSGRYTLRLESLCRLVVAVDISLAGLTRIAKQVPAPNKVALLQADISHLQFRGQGFDRVLSTLTSNLPTRELRSRMFQLAAESLAPGGIFVFGAHHWGPAALRQQLPKEGYYDGDGIYRYYMTTQELKSEAQQYFSRVAVRPVCVAPPGSMRLGLPIYPVSRFCEQIPMLRNFGKLLLGVAEK
jgi:SAM-dependent methyltransferase